MGSLDISFTILKDNKGVEICALPDVSTCPNKGDQVEIKGIMYSVHTVIWRIPQYVPTAKVFVYLSPL